LCDYAVRFKDEDVCLMVPKDRNRRPINIPQKPGPQGISVEIIEHMLFEARLDSFKYQGLLERVQAKQQARQDAQTRNL